MLCSIKLTFCLEDMRINFGGVSGQLYNFSVSLLTKLL